MTELELQELSKAVAAKYGIEAYTFSAVDCFPLLGLDDAIWLHADSGRCFDLAAEEGIDISWSGESAMCFSNVLGSPELEEFYANFGNNKPQAARVAVLKALLEKGK